MSEFEWISIIIMILSSNQIFWYKTVMIMMLIIRRLFENPKGKIIMIKCLWI